MNSNSLQNKRILLVDDEDFLREVLSEIFNSAGAITNTAENGTVAFELLQKDRYDAVISDIRMSGGDGVTLAQNIKTKLNYRPKLFLCSGFNDIPIDQIQNLEVVEVLTKPFNVDQLIQSVTKSLQ
jgi:CheY-like chemotaxis protein